MVHEPAIIGESGPPLRYWCMRFEAFHNICKRVAHANCNFVNIAKSVAHHLQTVSCAAILYDKIITSKEFSFGPSDVDGISYFRKFNLEKFVDVFQVPKWVKFNGREFRNGSVLLLNHSHKKESGHPEFGIVRKIEVHNEKLLFAVNVYETSGFHDHFHSFEVQSLSDEKTVVVEYSNLPDCDPLWILQNFKVNDQTKFVSPKHWV